MNLYELAVSAFLAGGLMGDFGKSYADFQEAASPSPDLARPDHGQALLVWLNKWGCRQFARAYHELAGSEIAEWYVRYERSLPPETVTLWDATDGQLQDAANAYGELTEKIASHRKGGPVRVGATGAAKILFALRPGLLAPWDDPIRGHFGCDGSADSYLDFIRRTKGELGRLAEKCSQHGFHVVDLPARLGRPDATMPRLIDEYYWITITRGVVIPSSETVTGWLAWTGEKG
jgi:hypothetical protein